MRVIPTALTEVLLIEPEVFSDNRGFFFESFNKRRLAEATGLDVDFLQDNHSLSKKGTLRGLHYQLEQPQGKLVRVIEGSIFDVAVDIRRSSPTFGHWVGEELSHENKKQLWVPPGYAHGFLTLSDTAQVIYKTTDYYAPEDEHAIFYADDRLKITWPDTGVNISLSEKDRAAKLMSEAELPA